MIPAIGRKYPRQKGELIIKILGTFSSGLIILVSRNLPMKLFVYNVGGMVAMYCQY